VSPAAVVLLAAGVGVVAWVKARRRAGAGLAVYPQGTPGKT